MLMKRRHRLPSALCPHCGAFNDGATSHEHGPGPQPGDLAVCVYCVGVNVYGEGLRLRRATDADLEGLAPKERAMLALMQRAATDVGLSAPDAGSPTVTN